MTMLTAIVLAAQAAAAPAAPVPAAPPPPAVPMTVAKARVDKVKALLAVAASGDAAALGAVVAPSATANVNGATSPLTAAAIAGLKTCTRKGPFTVNDEQVIFTMTCTGTLPALSSAMVGFTAEQIASLVVGPAPPPMPVPAGGN
jgi:hypothetical protein